MKDEKLILEEIKKLKETNKLIIVEGRKDRIALESLGLKNIIELNKKPLYFIIEEISKKHKEVVILTDLDKEGKKLFSKLNAGFSNHGVKVDKRFREFLFKETKLRQIEGLDSYLEKNNINLRKEDKDE